MNQTEPKTETKTKTLGERMKEYEAQPFEHIDGHYVLPCDGRPVMARIDGHCFSKFTKGFKKPFDEKFSQAMVQTACDLLQEFKACTAYTQSDEITLIFIPVKNEETSEWREWPFRGRVVKMCSLLASYASTRFNHHLVTIFQESTDAERLPRVLNQRSNRLSRGQVPARRCSKRSICKRLILMLGYLWYPQTKRCTITFIGEWPTTVHAIPSMVWPEVIFPPRHCMGRTDTSKKHCF